MADSYKPCLVVHVFMTGTLLYDMIEQLNCLAILLVLDVENKKAFGFDYLQPACDSVERTKGCKQSLLKLQCIAS